MSNRRNFLRAVSSVPLVGGLPTAGKPLAAGPRRDFFKEIGVRPFINAAGTYTALTASLMPPEVVQAWLYGARHYVNLDQLHDAVGARIASLVGCESAMVTAGAASALTLGTAACITGVNRTFIRSLPDTAGMKNEVIIQKSHHYGYEHAVRNCGIRFVDVVTRQDLERAVSDRTAMMLFFNANDAEGQIKAAEFADLGKKNGIPTMNDAAADVPPVENLFKYTKMGYDLVTFSGGKGLCGPQSAGLLLGRKALIQAARLNTSPSSDTIGRGMKVNKEEMLAMLVAVETYLKRDHQADWREWERRVNVIAATVSAVRGVTTEVWIPEIANHVPHLRIRWDQTAVKISPAEAARRLREGEPSIEVVPGSRDQLVVAVWMMQRNETQIVARRIRQILQNAA
jgi:L-seryl-tRNA(Ser) seleniumtransferase